MNTEQIKSLLLDDRLVSRFAELNGGRELHRAWRDTMLSQQRFIPKERMKWDTLPEQDKKLDVTIAYDVILDFCVWLYGIIETTPPEVTDMTTTRRLE